MRINTYTNQNCQAINTMKALYKYTIISFFIFVLINLQFDGICFLKSAKAQDGLSGIHKAALDIRPQTPNAASLGVYGNEPVSLYTGKISPSIQLTTVNLNNYSMNIGLSYNYNGFKPEVIPGAAGMGWALNAGGVITRTIRSFRDEENGGYSDPDTQLNLRNISSNSELNAFSSLVVKGNYEAKPDIFYFNFNGISVSFFLDKNGDFQVYSDRPL